MTAGVATRNLVGFRGRGRPQLLTVGLILLAVFALIGILAPWLAPYDPEKINGSLVFQGPSWAHLFGCDDLGRDVLSRLLYAYRSSLGAAVGSVGLALAVGVPIGLLAGYCGRWTDQILMRLIDLLLAFPTMVLAISFIAVLGSGIGVAILAIAAVYLPIVARITRSSVLVTRGQPFVKGARARGVSHLKIIVGHVLPNSIGVTLVLASTLGAFAIVVNAALSFIGLGAQPPTPEIGLMLAQGNSYLTVAPWIQIFPGIALALTVLAFNFVGDGLSRRLHLDKALA